MFSSFDIQEQILFENKLDIQHYPFKINNEFADNNLSKAINSFSYIFTSEKNEKYHKLIDCHHFLYILYSGKFATLSNNIWSFKTSGIIIKDEKELEIGDFIEFCGTKICKMNNIAYSHSVIYIGKSSNGQNLYLGKYGRRKKFLIMDSKNIGRYINHGDEKSEFQIGRVQKIDGIDIKDCNSSITKEFFEIDNLKKNLVNLKKLFETEKINIIS
jgi:hypothetical protein